MSFRKATLAAMLAASMVSTPVFAQTATAASSLSVAQARTGASMDESSEMRGGWIIPLLAILAVIGGVIAAVGNNNDGPTSP